MGEEPWRIHNVGAPQLDEIINGRKLPKQELEKRYRINFDDPVLLLIQHPVLIDTESAYEQMIETLEAIEHCQIPTIIDLPNIDPGGTEIGKAIQNYAHLPFVHADKNIDRETFISLLSTVSAIVGNSSCGILEAPSFKLPSINIGIRQRGRFRASNVIDVDHDKNQIIEAIQVALHDKAFHSKLRSCQNPYGDGHSSERIVNLLKSLEITQNLLDKQITY
jgi:UDP-hydrolysing UDP-N-acetyl-D-glucosamine 2-epimerase